MKSLSAVFSSTWVIPKRKETVYVPTAYADMSIVVANVIVSVSKLKSFVKTPPVSVTLTPPGPVTVTVNAVLVGINLPKFLTFAWTVKLPAKTVGMLVYSYPLTISPNQTSDNSRL